MRIGIACPYTWDVPGGVQAHVRDLADSLIALGHEVSVLTPVDDPDQELPAYVVAAGRAVPVPYNGSVARLVFGPLSLTRTRRWLREGQFDVLHVHEPTVPSVSMLATFAASGPMVATFHTAMARSRALQVFGTALQPALEKITARIAVSPAARRVVVEHLGGDAVLIPNGVDVARFTGAAPLPGRTPAPTVVFLGRIDEGRTLGVHRGGSSGEDDRRRVLREHLLDGGGVRDDLGVDLGLAHASSDELRVLGTEVDHEDGTWQGRELCHLDRIVGARRSGSDHPVYEISTRRLSARAASSSSPPSAATGTALP